MKMVASMRTNTNNYRKYGMIYANECTRCIREGTHFCKLEFDDDSCVNFKQLSDLKFTQKN